MSVEEAREGSEDFRECGTPKQTGPRVLHRAGAGPGAGGVLRCHTPDNLMDDAAAGPPITHREIRTIAGHLVHAFIWQACT